VVSRAVVPLEQGGLLERRADPDDARATRLGLTPVGRQRLAEAREDFADRFTPLLDDWDGSDLVTLTALMARLEAALCERFVHPGSGPAAAAPVAS